MSFSIPNAHIEAFKSSVLFTAQQKGTKLRRTLSEEQIIGRTGNFERLGPVELQERTGRHVDTPLINTPHSRRRVDIKDWEIADLVDDQDRLKIIINAGTAYAEDFGMAAGRKIDEVILQQLNGIAVDGDSNNVAFDAGNSPSLALGGVAALNLQLIIDARTKMLENDVDDGEDFHIAIDGAGLRQLMGEAGGTTHVPTTGNADYNAILAIQRGTITEFAGFTWHIMSPKLMPKVPGLASTDRFAMCWTRMGGKTGMQKSPSVRISERPDKSYSNQVYLSSSFNVVRMDEARVARIQFDSTAAPLVNT